MSIRIRVKNSGVVKLAAHKDPKRGDLFVAEAKKNVPFPIRRVYFINNLQHVSVSRGGHAHRKLTQAIFCVNGSFVLSLDDGKRKQSILMNQPEVGIILGPKLWVTMSKFSKDCVILLISSDYYDARDYIKTYDDFLKFIEHGSQK